MNLEPYEYQRIGLQHVRKYPRCAVWAEMGLGKTSMCLLAAAEHLLYEGSKVLVIAPKLVALETWPLEVEKWDNLRGLRVSPIIGGLVARKRGLLAKADIYTINYENIPWLVEFLDGAQPFSMVIADESTRLKSFRRAGKHGKRARALYKALRGTDTRFVELTGTPSPNGLTDLWGQFYFLDEGAALGHSYDAFQKRWFRPVNCGGAFTRWDPMPHSNDEIIARCSPLALSLRARDWFPDLTEPIERNIEVQLPPKVAEQYAGMEKNLFAEIDSGELTARNAADKSNKCLQITSGAVYTNKERSAWEVLHDVKMAALESIIEEAAGMPVLVAYHFRHELPRLMERFPRGRVLDGRSRTLRDWNTGSIPVLFAHPDSAGHGLNLQDGGNVIAFYTCGWKLESRLQIIERIGPVRQLQSGHNRHVFIYNIVVPKTIDEVVLDRHRTKTTVQEALMKYRRVIPCR